MVKGTEFEDYFSPAKEASADPSAEQQYVRPAEEDRQAKRSTGSSRVAPKRLSEIEIVVKDGSIGMSKTLSGGEALYNTQFICACCGKSRYRNAQWAYKRKVKGLTKYFCSYSCMRKFDQ